MKDAKIKIGHEVYGSSSDRAARFPQYLAAVIANIGGLICGTCLGWTSSTSTPLENGEYGFVVTSDDCSWIASAMALGAVGAGPLTGWLVDRVGRKSTQLILALPAVVGWALMVWANSVSMFIAGRFITGIAAGGLSIVCPLFTSEYSEIEIRGRVGCCFQLLMNIGILFTYVVGYIGDVYWLSVCCLIIPIVYGVLMLFIPESPIFYLEKRRFEEARASLQWFRGRHYNIEMEFSVLKKNIEIMEAEQVPFLKAFSTVAAKRALVIGVGVMVFQQLSGINSVIFYTVSIFEAAGANINANVETIITGVVGVVFTYISSNIVEKMGRRPLLLMSALVMAICSFLLGLYFYLKVNTTIDISTITWLPILSVCVFIIVFDLGFGPIPWMFVSEVNPRQIAGYAASICCMTNWLGAFLVTKFFNDVVTAVGTYGAFWIFTLVSVAATGFVFFLVPETKGRTLEEVQLILSGRFS